MGAFQRALAHVKGSRTPELPLYEKLDLPAPTAKRRYTGPSNFTESDISDDDDASEYSISSSDSIDSSTQRSSSLSSETHMIPRAHSLNSRQSASKRSLYRVPNRLLRYLCLGVLMTMVLLIFSLFRASQAENRRIVDGKVQKQAPPPPVWESFGFLTRYYGGIRTLVPLEENIPQYPRFEDEAPSNASRAKDRGTNSQPVRDLDTPDQILGLSKPFNEHPLSSINEGGEELKECFLDWQKLVKIPALHYYDGRPSGFPKNVLGSYELFSLPEDICFERFGRYGPYGFGYSLSAGGLGAGEHGEAEGADGVWQASGKIDWRGFHWADAQRRCYKANAARYKPLTPQPDRARGFYIAEGLRQDGSTTSIEARSLPDNESQLSSPANSSSVPKERVEGSIPRTAFVIRCWDEFEWTAEARMTLRSIITELSLSSGGRYDVHLLVQVKNDARYPIWADDDVYRQRIRETVPEEFQGLVTLWSQTQMLALYQGLHDLFTTGPDNPVHGAYRGLQMAMQHFAYEHPEYDHYWQWEMDIRYTGHYLDLISKIEKWAKIQPRKGLWERNARFYVPDVHGSWEDFKQMARVQSDVESVGTGNVFDGATGFQKDPQVTKAETAVWGPLRPTDKNDWYGVENDPIPPSSPERDRYDWGVGEEADLITFNPLFDPEGTTWGLRNDITGYNESEGIGKPPRRAQIISASRMSRRLLLTMHRETAFKKHHAFPEMWPATISLHHGYKAVFAPHPVYVDREWPLEYLARVLNGGRNGASGGSRTSVFGEREHNLRGLTWFYNSGFGGNLYRRWLGLRVNNDGGEEFEKTADLSKDDSSVPQMRGGEGRMCLPPMLLHPVKDVKLPIEEAPPEDISIDSDPTA
ncbi:hypothetical protein VTK73DRAFT_8889 [Phialemonium thermophilum]|uniref:Major facilitator superfamily transporter n=1 Tax=Phialemonium thermophilum TaxID=223376 RepID=A0ABR3XM58_9PEZI